MTCNINGRPTKMKYAMRHKREDGFSLLEMMVAILILVPIMSAAVSLFSVGVDQHGSEQSSIEANQEARSALDMMTMEIAQAGSHGDRSTTLTSPIAATSSVQTVPVASAAGLYTGDYLDVDTGASRESVKITAVSDNAISGVFRTAHASGAPIRLFALPYVEGVIPPAGLGPNSSVAVSSLRFFGDINSDGNLYYVEYQYDSNSGRILRSMTPITQTAKNSATSLLHNISPNSAQFVLNTDALGVITSIAVSMTVENTWKSGSKYQQTELSSRVSIPSAVAGSALLSENRTYGGINRLPPTPNRVSIWAANY